MRKIGLRAKFINSSVNIFKLKTLSLPCLHEWKQSSLREVCVCFSSYWEVVIKWRNQRGTLHSLNSNRSIDASKYGHKLCITIWRLVFMGKILQHLLHLLDWILLAPPTTTTTMYNLPPVAMQVYIFHQGGAERLDWIMRGIERKIIQTHHRHVQHGLRSNSYQTLKAYMFY